MFAIDHVGILAREAEASAEFLAEILGVGQAVPAGPDGDLYRLDFGGSGTLIYFPAETVVGQHVAFRVDAATFDAMVERLRSKGVVFGNEPEAQENLQTSDSFGGHGRVFFRDPNGHLFEVVA